MSTALIIIDMINTLDFPEGKRLLKHANTAAKNIKRIKMKFRSRKMPVIYVNDNFGKWRANWEEVYEKCSSDKSLGKEISQLLRPEKEDYFILKPKHSGFYCTNLDVLLEELKVNKLIITGMAGNICVLFTANDAYMRGYKIHVPRNCIASNSVRLNNFVITQLTEVFQIKTENM